MGLLVVVCCLSFFLFLLVVCLVIWLLIWLDDGKTNREGLHMTAIKNN